MDNLHPNRRLTGASRVVTDLDDPRGVMNALGLDHGRVADGRETSSNGTLVYCLSAQSLGPLTLSPSAFIGAYVVLYGETEANQRLQELRLEELGVDVGRLFLVNESTAGARKPEDNKSVYVCEKGGDDFWFHQGDQWVLASPPSIDIDHKVLALSLASALALGLPPNDAAVFANALAHRLSIDPTAPPLPFGEDDFPTMVPRNSAAAQLSFARLGRIGPGPAFYPIVDSTEALRQILPAQIPMCQLRIKERSGAELENEIAAAIDLTRSTRCALFINDYWELAIKHGAYGVHLGQEDLLTADLTAIADAGLRLGVSTHCYHEAAITKSINPSYVALGPIYPTKLKVMPFPPQGIGVLKHWRSIFASTPLVAIGGITTSNVEPIIEAGADIISVVGDLNRPEGLRFGAELWMKRLANAAD